MPLLIFLSLLFFNCLNSRAEIVLRLFPTNQNHMKLLRDLQNKEGLISIDFWRFPKYANDTADLMISDNLRESIERKFSDIGMKFELQIADVKKLVENERKSILRKRRKRSNPIYYDFYNYHTFEEMRRYLEHLSVKYSSIAELQIIGQTYEKRPVFVMKVHGKSTNNYVKPAIWIDGGIHAREWVASHSVMYFINELITRYENNNEIAKLVDSVDWYLAPNLNPDGYAFTWSTDGGLYERLWRKNRSSNKCIWFHDKMRCCAGVDLNRNFEARWGEVGLTTATPCEQNFIGEYAFSETESKAVRDFIVPRRSNIKAFITIHCFAQMWLHSFGYGQGVYPHDIGDLNATGIKAAAAAESLYGMKYQFGSFSELMYPASGTSVDWAKEQGIKYSYTIELRPSKNVTRLNDGFMLPIEQLVPTAKETWEGIKVIGDIVIEKFT